MNNPFKMVEAMTRMPVIYGWYDFTHRKVITPNDKEWNEEGYFDENCRILKPDELEKYQVGTCYDISLYEYLQLSKMNYNPKFVFICLKDGRSHTAVFFKYHRLWWWMEYAWYAQKGIHGPCKLDSEILEIFLELYTDGNKDKIFYLNEDVQNVKPMTLRKEPVSYIDFIQLVDPNNKLGCLE